MSSCPVPSCWRPPASSWDEDGVGGPWIPLIDSLLRDRGQCGGPATSSASTRRRITPVRLTNLLSATADVGPVPEGPWLRSRPPGHYIRPASRKPWSWRRSAGSDRRRPGTGRATVGASCPFFGRMGLCHRLATPAGRAAQRLGNSRAGSQTLSPFARHELERDTHGDASPRAKGAWRPTPVIVVEMSMWTCPSCALLHALRPSTRLVMVGGRRPKLPSVGPGNVFSDLIRSGRWRPSSCSLPPGGNAPPSSTNARRQRRGTPPAPRTTRGDFLCRRDVTRPGGLPPWWSSVNPPPEDGHPREATSRSDPPPAKGSAGTEEASTASCRRP